MRLITVQEWAMATAITVQEWAMATAIVYERTREKFLLWFIVRENEGTVISLICPDYRAWI